MRAGWRTGFAAIALSLGGGALAVALAAPPTEPGDRPKADRPKAVEPKQGSFETVSIRGKAVWHSEALKRRFGVDVDPDAAKTQIVLETEAGELYPLVKEFRGRGFWKDERLRDIDIELLARKFHGTNYLQVVQLYSWKKGERYELDYWCDICAIPMYELKECECCQGPIRIRERRFPPGQAQASPEK